MLVYITECDIFTFEEASKRFEMCSERYSHLAPVTITYSKGAFALSYAKENENDND